MRKAIWAVALVGMMVAGLFASAEALTFHATLEGSQEVPSNASPATGFAKIFLNEAEDELTFFVTFSGLLAPQTAAHIHALAPRGVNAPVRIEPPTLPLGELDGVVIDIPDPLPGVPLLSRADFVQGMKDGLTYFNVHTQLFPGGEIRGQILLPEPATMFLVAAGLAGLAGMRWVRGRRR